MKTLKQVSKEYKSETLDGRDLSRLMGFIPENQLSGFGLELKDEYKGKSYCPVCGENVEISNVEISYAFKLILDEFKSLGIHQKLQLKRERF